MNRVTDEEMATMMKLAQKGAALGVEYARDVPRLVGDLKYWRARAAILEKHCDLVVQAPEGAQAYAIAQLNLARKVGE